MGSLQPLGIDRAGGLEGTLGLLEVVVRHRVAAQVHVAEVRVVDDDAGIRAFPEVQLVVERRVGVLVPDGVVVPRTRRSHLVVQRAGGRDRGAALVVEAIGVGEFHGHDQALDRARRHLRLVPKLTLEQRRQLERARRGRVALEPGALERPDGAPRCRRVGARQENLLLLQELLDRLVTRRHVVRVELGRLEHLQRADVAGRGRDWLRGREHPHHQRSHCHQHSTSPEHQRPHGSLLSCTCGPRSHLPGRLGGRTHRTAVSVGIALHSSGALDPRRRDARVARLHRRPGCGGHGGDQSATTCPSSVPARARPHPVEAARFW